ncbi:hypothetical protein OQA88_2613 [Cercophora sp. LCS_1]
MESAEDLEAGTIQNDPTSPTSDQTAVNRLLNRYRKRRGHDDAQQLADPRASATSQMAGGRNDEDVKKAETEGPTVPSPYGLEVLTTPDDGQAHCVDVVAVHDYDEKSANWTYRDRDSVLRTAIKTIKSKKPILKDISETASLTAGGDVTGRGRQFSVHQVASQLEAVRAAADDEPHNKPPGIVAVLDNQDAASNTEITHSRAPSPPGAPGVSWLQDAAMLPKALPGVRVLAFSYPTKDLEHLDVNPDHKGSSTFIGDAASGLLRHLQEVRSTVDVEKVPVVFIGAGLGGLIVQEAMSICLDSDKGGGPVGDTGMGHARGKEAEVSGQDSQPDEPVGSALHPALHVGQIADIILLDTPFPRREARSEDLKEFFPSSVAGVRMSAIARITKRMESEWGSRGIDDIWTTFWAALSRRGKVTRLAWLYSTTQPTASREDSPVPVDDRLPVIRLNRIPLRPFTRLTNFRGPDDLGYQVTVARLYHSLMITAVSSRKRKQLQLNLMKAGSPFDLKDEWSVSLLHLAAVAPNPEGVNMLLGNGANSQVRDPQGQTPLHCAIRRFYSLDGQPSHGSTTADEIQDCLHTIISQLLSFTTKSELNNSRDMHEYTSRDIIAQYRCACVTPPCKHDALKVLLHNHQPRAIRRQDGKSRSRWEGWCSPATGTLEWRACERATAIIAEFYRTADGPLADYEVPNVYRLIYDEDEGPVGILSGLADRISTKGNPDLRCRWVHVPANNEQWIDDLFIRLKLREITLEGHRNEGYTVFNRYMIPQTRRYKTALSPGSPRPRSTLPSGASDKGFDEWDSPRLPKALRTDTLRPPLRSPKSLPSISDAIGIFMPILAYEQHSARGQMTNAIRRTLKARSRLQNPLARQSTVLSYASTELKLDDDRVDTSLIEAYIDSDKPIHCRRTLDQYEYYMLENTEARDMDQVVYRWAEKQGYEDKKRPVIMVDQLWLWVLPNGTVVSSLPNVANLNSADPYEYNLKDKLETSLFTEVDAPVQSVDDLVMTIIKTCVDFFRREGPCKVKFHDCFQYSISHIAEVEASLYAEYKEIVEYLDEKQKDRQFTLSLEDTEVFSRITEETNKTVEIMDIQDELKIVDSVLEVQEKVLQDLENQVTENDWLKKDPTAFGDPLRIREASKIVGENRKRISGMIDSAKRVQEDLKQLLDFKQQQSNAWEMKYSRHLAQQGRRQNNIMLVFTLVTIVFLPLSFMSSFFAIGIAEFPKDETSGEIAWPLGVVAAWLFGISIAVSLPMILSAFHVDAITKTAKRKRRSVPDPSAPKRPRRRSSVAVTVAPITTRKYAPLFGRYTFIGLVPFIRKLWRYRPYRVVELEGLDPGMEDLEWDYPLSRIRKTMAWPVEELLRRAGLGKLGKAYRKHERQYRLGRQRDGLVRQLMEEKMEMKERDGASARRPFGREPGGALAAAGFRPGVGLMDALAGRGRNVEF